MLIVEGDNFLEMLAIERVAYNLPASGDTRFEISVRSLGFAGQGWTWIEEVNIRNFIENLRELEQERRGRTELFSLSPSQFQLEIYSTNNLGHIALVGRLSRREPEFNHEHLLEFGFSFDPGLLSNIIQNFEAILAGKLERD